MGTTLAAAATQTYCGRYVPAEIHGRAFTLLGVLKDGLAVVPLLAFGWASRVFGIRGGRVALGVVGVLIEERELGCASRVRERIER